MSPEDFVQPEPNYQIPEIKPADEDNEAPAIQMEAKEQEPQLKDAVTSKTDVFMSAAKVVNPGWSGLSQGTYPGKDFENDPDREDFNPVDKNLKNYYDGVPLDKAYLLHETKSTREFMHVRKQIISANYNESVVEDNTNFAGSLALYAAASLADPFSNALYAGFAGLTKVKKLGEILNNANKYQRGAAVGSVGAGVEGSTEYLIQESGARNYEEVGYASAFGFVLAGGGTFAYDSLKSNHTAKQDDAYQKLTDPNTRPTTDTMPRTEEETRELVDIIQGEGVLSPYRNKLAKFMSTWLPERIQNSPTFLAYKRGGAISALAHRFDTMPGLSTKTPDEKKLGTADEDIYNFEGKTAMDMKYELAEHQLYLERDRTDAYNLHVKEVSDKGDKPLSKEAFSEEIWKINQDYYNKYSEAKRQKISEIRNDEDMISDITKELYSKKEKEVTKMLEKDDTYNKLEEEAKTDFLEKRVEEEVNRFLEYEVDLAAREQLKGTPVAELDGRYGEAAEKALAASMNYYTNMNEALQKSGMPHSEYFDPKFYSPRIYDVDAIKADVKNAEAAFENAIRNSAEHKQNLIDAEIELKKASDEEINADAKDSGKRVAARNSIEIQIQKHEAKIKEAEGIKDRVLEVLNDPHASPIQKSIELTRAIKFSEQPIDPSVNVSFKSDGFIFTKKKNMIDEDYIDVTSIGDDSFSDIPKMSTDEFENVIKSGMAEPLSRAEHAMMNQNADVNPEKIRENVRKIIDKSESVQELMTATGTKIDDIIGDLESSALNDRRVGFDEFGSTQESIVKHELLHTLSKEIRASDKGLSDILEIQNEIEVKKLEILMEMERLGVDIHSPRWSESSGRLKQETWAERVNYMSDIESDELFSVAFSNPEIARALNNIKSNVEIDGKKISLLDKLIRVLLNALGVDKLDNKSILGNIVKAAKTNAKHNPKPLKKELELRNNYRDYETKIRSIDEELFPKRQQKEMTEEVLGGYTEGYASKSGNFDEAALNSFDRKNYNEVLRKDVQLDLEIKDLQNQKTELISKSDKSVEDISSYHEGRIANIENSLNMKVEKIKKDLEASMSKQNDNIKNAKAKIKSLAAFPKKSAKTSVKNIAGMDTLSQMGFPDQSGNLKGRKLTIDTTDPELQKYMRKNEALNNQIYHYSTTGRIAVQQATGFHNVKDYEAHLNENNMFTDKNERKIAMDLFELTLGTRQISDNPNSGWNKAVRNISTFNYVTMGGQFAKYGMSEIGAGIYATGFKYLSELIPAMGTVAKMYKGQNVSKMEMDLISLSEAGEIWTNNTNAKYGDYDYQESTFAGGLEDGLKRMSKGVFRWSGLEGISAITKIALPRAFMRRLLTETNEGKGAYDLVRWGITPEMITQIRKQPIIKNKDGVITDFNFDAWDEGLADKVQTSISRMSRDAILRPDATRVPAWMNDGGANPLVKLSKQFMSFAAMANERLLLRGLSERQAYAATGAIVSGGILAAIEISGEELAVSMGLMKQENRKYDLTTEKGRLALGQIVAFRNSFAGTGQFLMESIIDFNKFNGGERMIGKVGSATTGKVLLGSKAAKEYLWNGKKGTAAQTHFIKGSIPFNNMFGVDSINRNITKDIHTEAKERNFYQNDGGFDGFSEIGK